MDLAEHIWSTDENNELKKREIDTRESVRTVTSNQFITACGLENISLKARKLLYVAIGQCRVTDTEFYEYSLSVRDFAALMDVDPSNVYREGESIADELSKGFIKIKPESSTVKFKNYPLFAECYMDNANIVFALNKRMTDYFLMIKGSFTQPLLADFLKMKSPYSMAIWHLMQREMNSQKPGLTQTIAFQLSLQEIREVTGTQKKFERLSDIKRYVLDKAIREIEENCGVVITYTNIKRGRTVTGFQFEAVSEFHVDPSKIKQSTRNKVNVRKTQPMIEPQNNVKKSANKNEVPGQESIFDILEKMQ